MGFGRDTEDGAEEYAEVVRIGSCSAVAVKFYRTAREHKCPRYSSTKTRNYKSLDLSI